MYMYVHSLLLFFCCISLHVFGLFGYHGSRVRGKHFLTGHFRGNRFRGNTTHGEQSTGSGRNAVSEFPLPSLRNHVRILVWRGELTVYCIIVLILWALNLTASCYCSNFWQDRPSTFNDLSNPVIC